MRAISASTKRRSVNTGSREDQRLHDILAFVVVGFLAQLIDGALGMGFGVISSSILLAQGIPPPLASASVNAAKLPTTGTAALSHAYNRNVDWRIARKLCLFGTAGGISGALLLTSLKGAMLAYLVNAYLAFIGVLIVYRGFMNYTPRLVSGERTRTIGLVGGMIEGIGGSWGPIVTTGLLGSGTEPRYAIGSSNFSEFVVSIAVFSAFLGAFTVGYWHGGSDWRTVALPVVGLVLGGLPAAAFGGYLSKHAPRRPLTISVGCLALGIAVYRALFS
jgi:uncharacterized membrane protein YfcA